MKTSEEKRWERVHQQLLAESNGKAPVRVSSQRTLFGIKSHVEEVIEAVVAEDAVKCEKALGNNALFGSKASSHNQSCGKANSFVKTVKVVAAIIVKDGKVLATQRGYGDFEGGWEFPGGKVEQGETPEQALVREIEEELLVAVRVDSYVTTAEYDYDDFHLSMRCYACTLLEDNFVLTEHHAARWVGIDAIDSLDWLPADVQVVETIKKVDLV